MQHLQPFGEIRAAVFARGANIESISKISAKYRYIRKRKRASRELLNLTCNFGLQFELIQVIMTNWRGVHELAYHGELRRSIIAIL